MSDVDLEHTHCAPCPRCGRTVAAGTEKQHRCDLPGTTRILNGGHEVQVVTDPNVPPWPNDLWIVANGIKTLKGR